MTTTVEIGIEKKDKNEKDKTKAKFKDKTKGSAKGSITVEDNGDITINSDKGTGLILSFELDDDNWNNYHFANSPGSNPPKVSFVPTLLNNSTASEFTIDTPAVNQTGRTMTVTDLNDDSQTWSYTITLFLNADKTPSTDLPATLPLDPIIKNKN